MYIKLKDGNVDKYPYSINQLKQDNKDTSFPAKITDERLAEWGVYPVVYEETPTVNKRTQNIKQTSVPTQVNGKWIIGWDVTLSLIHI